MRVLLLGAGGHAQVVADILRSQMRAGDPVWFAGYLDDEADALRETMGVEVVGTLADRAVVPHDALIVAIGDNAVRRRLFDEAEDSGARFAIATHPSSTMASTVRLGAGTVLGPGAIVNTMAVVAANTIINTAASVDHHCQIGRHVHIAPGVRLAGDVRIGDGALIGIGAVVLPGRTIGPWAVVGAGAVVVDDVPPGTTVVGVPARPVLQTARSTR